MAGKVAKVHVAKFHEFNNAPFLEPNTPGVWNMESEDEVLGQLSNESFNRRVEILEQLLIKVRRNGGRLPYNNPRAIFNGLALALSDTNWDVRLKCIQLINEVIPQFGDGLDACMSIILGKLISNIGESKITVRRAVIQTLHVYMKCTEKVSTLMRAIVQYGLENDDPRVRKETVVALPMLFTPEFKRENFFDITQSLAKKLLDSSVEDNLRECALMTMDKIKNLVGEKEFNNYIHKLSAPLRRYYCQLTGVEDPVQETPRNQRPPPTNRSTKPENQGMPNTSRAQYVDTYEFGIIPSHVMKQINDQENFKSRAQGVEDLKQIVRELQNSEVTGNLMPHMMAFISFLNNLLDDSNFKITTVTLEILNILVEKLGPNVKQFLKPLASTLTKRMHENKIVIRTAVMKVAIKMMQSFKARSVLSVISFDNLQHRNSRVRQEALNIIIASLLTFPSYEFDLPQICSIVAPSLTDTKRQVRQAALECFSVIAQAMGQGRLQPLVQAVDSVELSSEGEGVMSAVQARLARRQLPKLNSEGLVEYATPIPSSASSRSSQQTHGADMEWIMAVGSTGSARNLSRNDTLELESVTPSVRSTPIFADNTASGPRRFLSAGRGRNKLPWEEEKDDRLKGHGQNDGPPKARSTWTNDEGTPDNGKRVPKRKITVVGINQVEDPVQDASTYKQIHLNKLKKGTSSNKLNSSLPGAFDLDDHREVKENKENGFNKPPVKPFVEAKPVAPASKNIPEVKSTAPIIKPSLEAKTAPPPVKSFLESKPVKSKSPAIDVSSPGGQNEDSRPPGREDESPIPLKPALARSATRRPANKKVPPITAHSEKFISSNEDDVDSAYAASLESTLEAESHSEMMNSLRSIRNSASKKKEEVERHSSQQVSRSPSPDLLESGVWSASSYRDESDISSQTSSKKGYKTDSPFDKPKLARTGSFKKKTTNSEPQQSSRLESLESSSGMIHIDFNPTSGVTFRENKTSDVQVVGKGYSDDSTDSRSNISGGGAGGGNSKSKERRPVKKGPLLSPLGVASMHSHGAIDWDDDKSPTTQDSIGVIGKGMFDSTNGVDHAITAGNSQSQDKHDKKPLKTDRSTIPTGVIGVGMNRQGSNDEPNLYVAEDLDEDPYRSVNAIKERKAQKQREEEIEFQRIEREKKKQEHEEKVRKERERQMEKLKRLNTNESLALSISGSGSSTPKTKSSPSMSPRKRTKPQVNGYSSHPVSASSRSPFESENPDDWQPYKDPEGALRDAHKQLADENWDTKCSGINKIRRLAMYHPDILNSQLHPVIIAMVNEVKNLRSQVSRLAIVCVGDMFQHLGKGMDADIDITAKALLAKNGESNGFIREDVERALTCMVETGTPQRVLLALIAGGATHKNTVIRKVTSQFLIDIVERMGPGRVLSGIKDVTDRVLPTAAHFCLDSSQETRYNGRRILSMLMAHQDFDKMLSKHLPANTLRNVKDIVENLKVKGLGDPPQKESSSARGWRSGPSSRAGSMVRGGSAGSEFVRSSPKKLVRTDEATQDEIKDMNTLMSASDFRDRQKGIAQFLEMCESNTPVVAANIVKIFDKFLPRLQDPNSKVNLFALQVMQQIIPLLADSLATVLNIAVGNVAPNLSSKNREIYTTAMEVIDTFMLHIDGALLIQPMSNQAQSASARSKPDLVEKVAQLVYKVYPKKQKQVVLHVLPLLWHLLGATNSSGAVQGGSSNIRSATAILVNALYSQMGNGLLEKATSDPNVTPRHVQLLQDMIER